MGAQTACPSRDKTAAGLTTRGFQDREALPLSERRRIGRRGAAFGTGEPAPVHMALGARFALVVLTSAHNSGIKFGLGAGPERGYE
jgi:hypothetical protein